MRLRRGLSNRLSIHSASIGCATVISRNLTRSRRRDLSSAICRALHSRCCCCRSISHRSLSILFSNSLSSSRVCTLSRSTDGGASCPGGRCGRCRRCSSCSRILCLNRIRRTGCCTVRLLCRYARGGLACFACNRSGFLPLNCFGRNSALYRTSFSLCASRRSLRNFTQSIRFELSLSRSLFCGGNVHALRLVRSGVCCIYYRSATDGIGRIDFGNIFRLRRNTTIQRLRSINRSSRFDRLFYTNCIMYFLFGVRFRCRFNRRFISDNCGVIKHLACRSAIRSFGYAGAFQRNFGIDRCGFFVNLFINCRSICTLSSRLSSVSTFFTLRILLCGRQALRLLVLNRRNLGSLGGCRHCSCRIRDCASSNIRVLVARSLRTSDFELKSALRHSRIATVSHTHRADMAAAFKRFCERSEARILVFVIHDIIFHRLFGVVGIIVNSSFGIHHVGNTVFVRHTNLIGEISLLSLVLRPLVFGRIVGPPSQIVHHGFVGILILGKVSGSRCCIPVFLVLCVIIPIGINCKDLRSICARSDVADFVAISVCKLCGFPDIFAQVILTLSFQFERAFFVGNDCGLTAVANPHRRCRRFIRCQPQTIPCIGSLNFTRGCNTTTVITLDGSCVKRTILANFDSLDLFVAVKNAFGFEYVLHCFLMRIIVIGSRIDSAFVQITLALYVSFIKIRFGMGNVFFGKHRLPTFGAFIASHFIQYTFTITKCITKMCANACELVHYATGFAKRVNAIHASDFQTGRFHHVIKFLRDFQKRIRNKRPCNKFRTGTTNHAVVQSSSGNAYNPNVQNEQYTLGPEHFEPVHSRFFCLFSRCRCECKGRQVDSYNTNDVTLSTFKNQLDKIPPNQEQHC